MILLFGLLAMTARNAVDPDLWWHLRTGQWILESGHIPHTDPFSFTRAGCPWIAHEWLSEVVFFGLWKYGGAGALIVFSALITAAGFMLLYLRCPGKPAISAAAVVLGALAAAPAWGVRPQMFTFTAASVVLWLLERAEDRPLLFLLIPPLFVLWLNLHAGFALGPGLLLAFSAGLIWEVAAGETPWLPVRGYLTRITIVLIACLALVPLNPSGTQLYRYPFDVLRSASMRSFIAEWFPPDFHQLRYLPLIAICLALLFAFARPQSRPKARTLFPLLLTLGLAMDAVRHIPLFVLLATPLLAATFSRARLVGEQPSADRTPRQVMFRATVLLLMAVFSLAKWGTLIRRQSKTEAELYPSRAMEFLQSQYGLPRSKGSAQPQGRRLFAYYDWGGYAVWRLYPDYRVFVDGRADLYGNDLLDQFKQLLQLQPSWRQVLDFWAVETVLMPASSALSQALTMDSGWQERYRDLQAVVFVRKQTTGVGNATNSVLDRQNPAKNPVP